MKKFNVIVYDFNRRKFVSYDVLPYFRRVYKERIERVGSILEELTGTENSEDKEFLRESLKSEYNKVPTTFDDFKEFVKKESMYQFWSRCEYEIILSDWPPSNPPVEEKWDVHEQIMMNLDIVAEILWKKL